MRDVYVALLLGAVTAASRIPFVADRLWEWDSVLYARALEQGFHVDDVLAGSRPHPPGYIFYVAAAALGKAAGLDSDHALVLVSVIASGVAVAAFYLLCRRFAGPRLSALLAAAFAADPLLWLHGEVAMPYVLLAPLMTMLAFAFLVSRGAAPARAIWSSFALGALAGFRQDLLLFLLPLWLWMLWPSSARTRAASVAALVLGGLLWFVPSALLSDGPAEYLASNVRQFVGLAGVSGNSGRSLAVNLILVGDSLAWALLLVLAPLAVIGLARALAEIRGTARTGAGGGEALFFALWLMPALLFYVLVHIGEWGFVLSVVPGLYALFAWVVRPLVPGLPAGLRFAGAAFVAASAALGAWLFAFGSHPVFSAASLEAHDRATDGKVAFIRETVPRDGAVILATAESLVARYYLPDHVVWYSDSASSAAYERRLPRPTTVVVYEQRARPAGLAPGRVVGAVDVWTLELVDLPAGTVLRIPGIDIDAGSPQRP